MVYTTWGLADRLREAVPAACLETAKFVYTTREELETVWLGQDNYACVQEVRQKSEWCDQAHLLGSSPQATLADYNQLKMAKMYMMPDVARANHWNTTHSIFLFLDAKNHCCDPRGMTPRSEHILRAHMLNKLLLNHVDYLPDTEVHGFAHYTLNGLLELPPEERVVVLVGRGSIVAGSAILLDAATAVYDVLLTASLREGLMGT